MIVMKVYGFIHQINSHLWHFGMPVTMVAMLEKIQSDIGSV